VVLSRVEDLEQGRRGISSPVRSNLVDLVQQDHRVHRLRVTEGADDAAGQRADVGAPVASDLGLVVDAAQREAHELAPQGAGDGLADGGLAGTRRSDQGEDRAIGTAFLLHPTLLAQLANRDELGDAPLHVLESGVILIEDLAGVLRIELLLGALRPRHGQQPVQVAADHRGLGRLLTLALQPAKLALGLLSDFLGHLRLGDLLLVLADNVALVLAELLADRLHLLAQEVLPLLLLGAGVDVVTDLDANL